MASVRWGEHTAPELARAAKENTLVLLPLGCTEQHAAHLPVDTDTYQVDRLCVDGAERARERGVEALVLPPLPYGPASEHFGLPGTISLPNEVYLQVVKHLLWSAIELGFRRLAVVRGCGGHWIVPGVVWDVAADAQRAGRDVTLRLLSVDQDWRAAQERHFPGSDGGHAAVMETALCLADRADLVRSDQMRAPALRMLEERYREGGEAFLFAEMSDTGALGDPSPATAAGGRAAWRDVTDAFAQRLCRIAEQDAALGRGQLERSER
ncbi:MAG TPA: creatininase family protein [Thermomicrobiaceae bacterium]|nr:creatininase family protein [Thermomicrobiaceae bacterium]